MPFQHPAVDCLSHSTQSTAVTVKESIQDPLPHMAPSPDMPLSPIRFLLLASKNDPELSFTVPELSLNTISDWSKLTASYSVLAADGIR